MWILLLLLYSWASLGSEWKWHLVRFWSGVKKERGQNIWLRKIYTRVIWTATAWSVRNKLNPEIRNTSSPKTVSIWWTVCVTFAAEKITIYQRKINKRRWIFWLPKTFGTGNSKKNLKEVYYSPNGYWKGYNAIDKLAKAGGVCKQEAREFLRIQPRWQIYLPAPTYIPRPKFDVYKPNEVHQADLLYLPHDSVKKKTFKYALTVVDVASRYKEAEPFSTKTSMEVAEALQRIYKRDPLRFPSLLQVDPGREFKGEVIHLAARKKMNIRWGRVNIRRDQGIVERFNRSLAERLFGYQYAEEMKNPGVRNVEWVRRLPEVLKEMNNEVTRLTGVKPV